MWRCRMQMVSTRGRFLVLIEPFCYEKVCQMANSETIFWGWSYLCDLRSAAIVQEINPWLLLDLESCSTHPNLPCPNPNQHNFFATNFQPELIILKKSFYVFFLVWPPATVSCSSVSLVALDSLLIIWIGLSSVILTAHLWPQMSETTHRSSTLNINSWLGLSMGMIMLAGVKFGLRLMGKLGHISLNWVLWVQVLSCWIVDTLFFETRIKPHLLKTLLLIS